MTEGQKRIHDALERAVTAAIEEVGLDTFKRTSIFLSNERVVK